MNTNINKNWSKNQAGVAKKKEKKQEDKRYPKLVKTLKGINLANFICYKNNGDKLLSTAQEIFELNEDTNHLVSIGGNSFDLASNFETLMRLTKILKQHLDALNNSYKDVDRHEVKKILLS